jgi:hypothetical protein
LLVIERFKLVVPLSFKPQMKSRMSAKWIILTLTAGMLAPACNTRNASGKDLELLTGKSWKYEKAEFDDEEGTFNALDPHITGTEKDNTVIFCKDGTGYSQYKHRSRSGNPDSLPFMWAFQNGDSTIYFQDQYYRVKALTAEKLEIYADQRFGTVSTRYTIIFTH